jgi:hypothetical protein
VDLPLLRDVLPSFGDELQHLLVKQGEPELAAQVPELRIAGRCHCGDDFCATFYVRPKRSGPFGAGHRNVCLEPEQGMVILDVVNGKIECVEVLYRDHIREAIHAAIP